MGLITVDNRESGGVLIERNTKTCHVCGAIIEYESRPIRNFLRRFRIYKRILPDGTIQSEEMVGGEYRCKYHDAILCFWCAEKAKHQRRCIGMEQVAEATVAAMAHKINVWSRNGQLYIENLLQKRIY